ncbi:glyoxalase-like protein [Stackebrandtia endophytica]|uniref:Glyoxalase-like protein n=1 Tax=Stackebrandtia endophytica TaxID=1496996 RepID=A0A543AUR5_9ACTN|nr:VOC family protein [Stackebrandtia endophytica]TQL76309.1 glyoxalase-like protein [Stackebrandtia endophytica]
MAFDIIRLHHTGHLVTDLTDTTDGYRRLGFSVPAATFPGLRAEDGRLRAIGAGNTRIAFDDNFIELVGLAGDRLPDDASITPLSLTPQSEAAIVDTTKRLEAELRDGEGVRILAWHAADLDTVAARLSRTDIPHSGVIRLERPGPDGATIPVGYLELDANGTPEGRLVVAEGTPAEATTHPNGAVRLTEAVLCVSSTTVVDRYRRYLDRDTDNGVFDLGDTRLWTATADDIARRFDGHRPAPGFVGHLVAVDDLARTLDHLCDNDIPIRYTDTEDVFTEMDGCLIGFTQV